MSARDTADAEPTKEMDTVGRPGDATTEVIITSKHIVGMFVERQQQLSVLVQGSVSHGGVDAAVSAGLVQPHQVEEFNLELKNYHMATVDAVAAALQSNTATGLSASDIAARQKADGLNVLSRPQSDPWILSLLHSVFVGGFAPLIWFATIIVLLTWRPLGTPPTDVYSLVLGIALIIVNLIAGITTYVQESYSSSVLAAFTSMVPSKCVAIRNGTACLLPASDLVVGDVIQLNSGSIVPADARIIQCSNLRVDTAMLTGEAKPVRASSTPVPASSTLSMLEAPNVLFTGTQVVEGSCTALVIATGDTVQLAKILRSSTETKKQPSHLQVEIDAFVKIIAFFAFITGAIVACVWGGYLNVRFTGFMTLAGMIANAISVVVAFVPEGLPLCLSVGLAFVSRRLCLQHFVLAKTLSKIETLGSVSFICSDKTGTLTQNSMTVTNSISITTSAATRSSAAEGGIRVVNAEAKAWDPLGESTLDGDAARAEQYHDVFAAAVLCNAANLKRPSPASADSASVASVDAVSVDVDMAADDDAVVGGNGVDKAMLKWVLATGGIEAVRALEARYTRVASVPFSSSTKTALQIVQNSSTGQYRVLSVGAPEVLLAQCTHAQVQPHASSTGTCPPTALVPLDAAVNAQLTSQMARAASKGFRIVAVAYRPLPEAHFPPGYLFDTTSLAYNFPSDGLTFLSLLVISDPPRKGVKEAVTDLRTAGIRLAMVTGDSPATAVAIAQQVGLVTVMSVTQWAEEAVTHQTIRSAKSTALTTVFPAPITASPKLKSTGTSDRAAAATAPVPSHSGPTAAVVTGAALRRFADAEWAKLLEHEELVFARTTPEQKLQIVERLKAAGYRVGVTGDGVNDAPALKAADIGIAMNSGSDVSREIASVVLLRDDFSAIVPGVREGRLLFANLRKVIAYQIAAGCWSELLPVLAIFFVGMPQPLSAFLMVLISCITDVAAGLALMHEEPEQAIMALPPRDPKKTPLVSLNLIAYSYLFYGTLSSIGSFLIWFHYMGTRGPLNSLPSPLPLDDSALDPSLFPIGYRAEQLIFAWNWGLPSGPLGADMIRAANTASSVFFMTLVMCQLGHVLSIRRKDTPYFSRVVSPDGTVLGWLAEAWRTAQFPRSILMAWIVELLTVLLITEVPFLQATCGTGSVAPRFWVYAALWSLLCLLLAEARKWAARSYPNNSFIRMTSF